MFVVLSNARARTRLAILLIGFAVIVGLLEASMVRGVRTVASLVNGRLLPVYCVEAQTKQVAISFDATWGADTTKALLDVLDEEGTKTTFFLAGYWLEKYPDMVREIVRRGHELGNHTYSHPHCNSLSADELRHELEQTQALIEAITGSETHLFRPPFGEYNNTVVSTAEAAGYTTVMWDVDSLDWKDLSSDDIVRRVMSRVQPGSIVLFHNAGKNTAPAVRTILRDLHKSGYQVVPVSQLLLKGETSVDHMGRQHPKTRKPAPAVAAPVFSSMPWATDEGGPGFAAAAAVVAQGVARVVTPAGHSVWYRGNPQKPEVALAVNVAWGEEYLPGMLSVLDEKKVKASFYFVGTWVRMFPELTRSIADAGHEIASHGYTHEHPTAISSAELERMITENGELLRETIGREPSLLFSPPYGELNDSVVDTAGRLGLTTTMWSADTIDWQRPTPEVITARALAKAENGAIVLLHPTAPTLAALPTLIDQLRSKGFRIVPVSRVLS